MCRFYGFSHSEVTNLPIESFMAYLIAINRLSSEERLMEIRVSAFNNMKKQHREKFERSLDKAANPNKYKAVEINPLDTGSVLEGILHG